LFNAYDLQPYANQVKQLQQNKVTVASWEKYHAQFQFMGRLREPVFQLTGTRQEKLHWLQQNPDAHLILIVPKITERQARLSVYSQAYRGRYILLFAARFSTILIE
jgi:hypothetical protein